MADIQSCVKHEEKIAAALERYQRCASERGAAEPCRQHWCEFVRLHAQRAPEQVAAMEQRMGLR